MRHHRLLLGLLLGGFVFVAARSQSIAQAPNLLAQGDAMDEDFPDRPAASPARSNRGAQMDEPKDESFLVWLLEVMGLFGLLAVLSGLAVFIGGCLVVFVSRRPAVIASYLPFLLLPSLFGTIGGLKALVSVTSVVAISGTDIRPSHLYGALSEAAVIPLTALLVTVPSFLVVSFGLFIRTALSGRQPATTESRIK